MKIRTAFLVFSLLFHAGVFCASPERPNLIVILTDDQGYHAENAVSASHLNHSTLQKRKHP